MVSPTMDLLRIVLFSGLVLHKVLWELLKRHSPSDERGSQASESLLKRFIKSVKVAILMFFAFQTLFLNLLPIAEEPYAFRIMGTAIYIVGLVTAILGRVQLGKNWVDMEDYRVLPQQSVTMTGIYRYIRHPIYTGDILLLTGLELALNSWLVLVVLIPLVVAVKQALAEEALLKRTFPAYRAYCKSTKRFVPFIA
jgi:protein-S-isoprenylcysteine O-methyltransferase Ste14